MATQKQTRKKRLNMAERAQQQMEIQFPNYSGELLWHRSQNDGYSTIPRTLPLAIQAIDAQCKGQPAGHTLLCLWLRAPDHPFITIEAPATFAAETGFDGERAVDTWRRRMRTLRELEFIEAKPGPSGDFHYVLLLNPNVGVEKLRRAGKIQDVLYARFVDRLYEIGAQDDISNYDNYLELLRVEKETKTTTEKKPAAPKESPKKPRTSIPTKQRVRSRSKES